jgi:hypothetical protein
VTQDNGEQKILEGGSVFLRKIPQLRLSKKDMK